MTPLALPKGDAKWNLFGRHPTYRLLVGNRRSESSGGTCKGNSTNVGYWFQPIFRLYPDKTRYTLKKLFIEIELLRDSRIVTPNYRKEMLRKKREEMSVYSLNVITDPREVRTKWGRNRKFLQVSGGYLESERIKEEPRVKDVESCVLYRVNTIISRFKSFNFLWGYFCHNNLLKKLIDEFKVIDVDFFHIVNPDGYVLDNIVVWGSQFLFLGFKQ